jgi:hypothetical protein
MRVMRLHQVVVVCGILAVGSGSVPAAQAQDVAKGAAILADARKVIGGEDRLRAVKSLQANGTFRRSAGNNTLEGDVEILIEVPDKLRRNESTGFAGGPTVERTEVLNGTEVWDETSGGTPGGFFIGGRDGGGRGFGGGGGRGRFGDAGVPGGQGGAQGGQRQIDPERLKEAQRRTRQADLSRLMLVWLLTTDAPVTWVGTAQSPEGNADVLEITPQGGTATRLFLDVTTHMPLMITWAGAAPRLQFTRRGGAAGAGDQAGAGAPAPPPAAPPAAPQQATIEMHLSEYKSVSGIKLPHLITRGFSGQTNEEWEVKSYKINPNFKANTFTK